ncbi:MAG: PepSY domain-containing protein [Sphingobacteriaceae bacterium]|nr:MAG: PepSY domain-containing protein [Sphingobacteriaceae bacterium]
MKKVFRNIHLYLSLAAGIIIFCSCLTGTVLVFEEEIEHALHQNRYYVQANGQRLPLSQLIFSTIKTVPKAKPASVKIYADAGRTVEIGVIVPEKKGAKSKNENPELSRSAVENLNNQLKNSKDLKEKKAGENGNRPNLTVFVNPYTGKIVDQFNRRKSFFNTAEMLHRFLLAGKNSIGNKIVGLSTLFFLFILITGVVLWWPKNRKILRQRLRYKWTGGWKRLTHDLHIVTGFYTSLFLLIIVLTGLIMTFPWANKLLFTISGSKPVSEQPKPPASVYKTGLTSLSTDRILENNQQEIKNAATYTVRLPHDSAGVFTLNILPRNAVETTGDTYFIDQYSGKILSIQKFSDKNAGQRARAFIKPIHTGSVYGLPTKILSFAVCLLSLIFPVTGVLMWLNRIQKKAGKRSISKYAVN